MEEITAVFIKERHRRDDWVIASCKSTSNGHMPITVKTNAEEDELQPHLTYRFFGKWTTHSTFGRQFDARTFVRAQPIGEVGVVKYLAQAPHVGPKTARRLWEVFQSDAIRI